MPLLRHRRSPCDRVRAQLSARHDGAPAGLEAAIGPDETDGHLAVCTGCRDFAARLPDLDAVVATARRAAAPDLTASVVAAVAAADEARRVRRLRGLVALAGVAQLVLAVPVLLALAGPSAHIGRDLGALQLALGVGLLFAARQPERAAGVLPIAAVVAGLALVAGVLDLAAGRATPLEELPHLSEVVGVVALWALTRRLPQPSAAAAVRSAA